VVINIFLISHQRNGKIQLLQYHRNHPNYHFSTIFSLTLLWDSPFIWVLGEIYWGTATASPPINLESNIELHQYHLIWGVVLGTTEILYCHRRIDAPTKTAPQHARRDVYPISYATLCSEASGSPIGGIVRHVLAIIRYHVDQSVATSVYIGLLVFPSHSLSRKIYSPCSKFFRRFWFSCRKFNLICRKYVQHLYIKINLLKN
jgi:hypothetical protein